MNHNTKKKNNLVGCLCCVEYLKGAKFGVFFRWFKFIHVIQDVLFEIGQRSCQAFCCILILPDIYLKNFFYCWSSLLEIPFPNTDQTRLELSPFFCHRLDSLAQAHLKFNHIPALRASQNLQVQVRLNWEIRLYSSSANLRL